MADVEAQSTLSVEVQGEEGINRLAAALASLQAQAAQVQAAVAAAPARVTPAAAQRTIQEVARKGAEEFNTLGARLAYRLSYGVGTGIRTGFDALKTSASVAGRAVAAFAGPLGQVATAGGPAATAVIGVGLAITGLAVPLLSFIAGLRLLRSSFGWAQEAAEEQMRIAGRTRRFFPQLIGEAVEGAEREMEARMTVASALFGDAADSMQEQVTRRFTAFRMGRGLRGERDIFARWGITPEAVARFERIAGTRLDVSGWLNQFVLKREELEERLAKAPRGSREEAMLRYKLGMIADDTAKLFGQKFSDTMGAMTSRDLTRLNENIRRALPLGEVEGATRRARDFDISLHSLKATFSALRMGIGRDVQPSITNFLAAVNQKLLDTEEGGQGLGRAFRTLASEMANKAWRALEDIMRRIDHRKVNAWIAAIQEWKPAETAESVKNLILGVLSFGRAVATLITAVQGFIEAMPSWTKIKEGVKGPNVWDWLRKRGETGEGAPTGGEGPASFAERFGGGGAAAGGGEGFGTLGPGLGAGAGLPSGPAPAPPPAAAPAPAPAPAPRAPPVQFPPVAAGPPQPPAERAPAMAPAAPPGGGAATGPGERAPPMAVQPAAGAPSPPPGGTAASGPPQPAGVGPAAAAPAAPTAAGATAPAQPPTGTTAAAGPPPAPPMGDAVTEASRQRRIDAARAKAGAGGRFGWGMGAQAATPATGPSAPAGGPPATAPPPAAPSEPTTPAIPPEGGAAVPPATGPSPPAPVQAAPAPEEKRPWYDPRRWFGGARAQGADSPTQGGAAMGAPAPPATAAADTPTPRAQSASETRAEIRGDRAPAGSAPEGMPAQTTPQRAASAETLKAAAAGRAMGLMADVQSTPSGDALVMKAGFKMPPTPEGSFPGAGALSAAGTAAGFLLPGAVGGAIEATTHGALYGAGGEDWRAPLRETIPGMGVLGMMKRDAEQGHPMRTYLREMMGLPDPGEPAPWQRGERGERAEALTAPFAERYGDWKGGITAEDGSNFGTAAAESLREGIHGLSIGGTPSTSYGVAPRSAPKNLGGDTPTEA